VRSQHDYRGKEDDGLTPIYRHDTPYPILKFQGTVKLHGTNSAIGIDYTGEWWTQSRNRLLTTEVNSKNDNQGFAHFVASLPEEVISIFEYADTIYYGEFCGGSIQNKVALNQLEKMFIIFSVWDISCDEWISTSLDGIDDNDIDTLNKNNIYLISQFPMYEIAIDFNNPELAQNRLIELTKAVGDCCPVGKTFGVEGIGEGIVWRCVTEGYESSDHWFKVKDERHQTSKVKTLAPIDIEKVNTVQEFVNKTVTENRLNQGIEYLNEMKIPLEMRSTGDFLKWIFNDILAEEADTLEENGLTRRDIGTPISRRAKEFWMNKLNEEVGL
jgi:CxxC motif-containing protein